MNVLYGLYQPTDGRVVVNGEPRDFDSPRDAIDAGIGMIHQHFMLVDPMTIAENIALGNEPRKWGGLTVDEEAARREVVELSERYGFDVDPDQTVAEASVGVQQRVEILKALYRGADILILDEPTAVLTPRRSRTSSVCSRSSPTRGRRSSSSRTSSARRCTPPTTSPSSGTASRSAPWPPTRRRVRNSPN